MVINGMNPIPEHTAGGYTETQKELADKIHALLMENLEKHITITDLARTLHVSSTHVKVSFHKVYGTPVYSYTRQCRMKAAAKMLEETDDSILEIAGRHGYENGSKFATAFRRIMGISPSEYRKRVRWEQENRDR